MFTLSGERLTSRLRAAVYRSLIRQEIGFFDDPQNSTGRLATRLSADAALVKASTGDRLGRALQAVASLLAGLGIAFYASWKLALIVLATFPVIAGVQASGGGAAGVAGKL